MEKGKRELSFNIVNSGTKHKGFGAGSIDLSQVSSVIIDGDEAYIDIGALHAKSKVEKRIKFTPNKEDTPGGRLCWVVWVAVDRSEQGSHYAGVTACDMLIDEEARRGYKILADHVNKMDQAMKRKIIVDGLSDKEKKLLKQVLIDNNPEMWERSSDELKQALST